ncbi:MAG: hypothetical protein A4E66_02103 [Syntrophus sp. PtaB.Bin001]|nr:MAG: hypothetical protein A4E66_02103 [Syntrophus sp. PtaB.Bin001]
MLHRCLVSFAVAEREGNQRLFFRNDPFLSRLRGPGEGDACRHDIESHLFCDVDDREDSEAIIDREHRSYGKDRLVIVGDLAIEIAVLLLKAFPYKPDVDAPHRAARAGGIPEQRLFRKLLSRNVTDGGIGRPLEVADGQHLQFVQHCHVYGCADVVVLAHHVGIGELCIDFLKDLRILFRSRQWENRIAMNHDGLEVFAAHHRSAAESSEMAIGIDVDFRHGRPALTRRPDAQVAPVSRTLVQAAQHLARFKNVLAPQIRDVSYLQVARTDNHAGWCFCLSCDDKGVKVCKANG